jgi:methylphosphotriester-DNA--protein-cysteine methyltransferase
MVKHEDLGDNKSEQTQKLFRLIRSGDVTLGGYKKGRIYGTLQCSSGKRMKLENRVFFKNEQEAIALGYRPCGNCMPQKYKIWKAERNKQDND